jgi:hypothetical protein
MTTYRRMLKSADGIVLSKEVRQNALEIVSHFYVTIRDRSEPRLFSDLAEAEAFFDKEALRILTAKQRE